MKFYFKKVKIAKIENKWGHRDLNPDPRISLVSVLQLVIILSSECALSSKTTGVPDDSQITL